MLIIHFFKQRIASWRTFFKIIFCFFAPHGPKDFPQMSITTIKKSKNGFNKRCSGCYSLLKYEISAYITKIPIPYWWCCQQVFFPEDKKCVKLRAITYAEFELHWLNNVHMNKKVSNNNKKSYSSKVNLIAVDTKHLG